MNKTFLLTAHAPFTEGSMLIVIDSLDDFVAQFKEYHHNKQDFMLNGVPEFYDHTLKHNREEWSDICDKHNKLEAKFVAANNCKPFDFEFSTGCHYTKNGRGAGNFHDNVKITTPDAKEEECWLVSLEFLSNLPTGTHHCSDYCA